MNPSDGRIEGAVRADETVRRQQRFLHFLAWFLGAVGSLLVGHFVAHEICYKYLGMGIGLGGVFWGAFIVPFFFTCGLAIWHVFICTSTDSVPTRFRFWLLHVLVPLLLLAVFVFLTTESESGVSALQTLTRLHGL